jgi:hypothetical protein
MESDLAYTTRFIEPCQENMSCHSIEFARLLLSAGSEIDVLCKVLCDKHGLTPSSETIDCYRKVIVPRFPGFTKLVIQIPRYKLSNLYPWKAWESDKTPDWWHSYNKVKHERNKNFQEANLKNVLDAMAGLFVLVCYMSHEELRNKTAKPWPQILTLDPSLSPYINSDKRAGYILPDFNAKP